MVKLNKAITDYSLTLLMGVALYAAANGCSKVSNYPSSTSVNGGNSLCPPNVGGSPASCCSGGTVISPPPSGCPNQLAGSGGIQSTLVGGATAAGAALVDGNNAKALVGTNGAAGAFANDVAGANGGSGTTSNTPISSSGSAASPNSTTGSAITGSGAGGGGSGSGLSLSGSNSTTGASDDSGAVAAGSPDVDVAGSTYGAGGAGGGAGGGVEKGSDVSHTLSGIFGSAGGMGGAVGGSGASSQLGFGNGREPASTMGTEDPADYFSLIDLNDNLFKRVETRYRNKQMTWAENNANETQQTYHPSAGSAVLPK